MIFKKFHIHLQDKKLYLFLLSFLLFIFTLSSCKEKEEYCVELPDYFKRILMDYGKSDLNNKTNCSILEEWKYINQEWYELYNNDRSWFKTESGLLYQVIQEGIGENKPGSESTVTITYTGSYINGNIFDSSTDMSSYVNSFVQGFQEVLKMMGINAVYEVIIPYELAYGESGSMNIPPYTTLKFRIELINFWTSQ